MFHITALRPGRLTIRIMMKAFDPSFGPGFLTAYDRALLRSMRIKQPSSFRVEPDPRLFYSGLILLVAGLGFIAWWVTYLVQMWD